MTGICKGIRHSKIITCQGLAAKSLHARALEQNHYMPGFYSKIITRQGFIAKSFTCQGLGAKSLHARVLSTCTLNHTQYIYSQQYLHKPLASMEQGRHLEWLQSYLNKYVFFHGTLLNNLVKMWQRSGQTRQAVHLSQAVCPLVSVDVWTCSCACMIIAVHAQVHVLGTSVSQTYQYNK